VRGAFAGERVVVVGAGVAGTAAAAVLAEEGADVRITDARPRAALVGLDALEASGIELRTGGHRADDLDDATFVVTSPGVPPDAAPLVWAAERGVPVWGEMEIGARLATAPYVAITGTNGKTTTTGMVEACLVEAGLDAVACGNIGRPFPAAAREGHDVLVVEVSSFQLVTQESFHPRVSALLNVAPDHLDWHGTYGAYVDAKARVHRNQTGDDVHVGNRDDETAAAVSSAAACSTVWFRLDPPERGEVGYRENELVARLVDEARLGPVDATRAGYRADAAAAAAVALSFGAPEDAVARGLARYRPARHRGEEVALVDGVRFFDNSKATNVHAALAAIEGVRDAVLIAGGRAKGQDLAALARGAPHLVAVVAIGESTRDVVQAFGASGVPVRTAGSIEDAVAVAFSLARRPGSVLLAPACASWDQFHDYAERGDRFAAAARTVGRAALGA
jgi:UDP-N-acetylmuramoylalanine--D-glutamate ligase